MGSIFNITRERLTQLYGEDMEPVLLKSKNGADGYKICIPYSEMNLEPEVNFETEKVY